MDLDRFDALTVRLTRLRSHRRSVGLLGLGGMLGLGGAMLNDATDAKKNKKKHRKKRKASAACTPRCSGKSCGDDGCGGSCGDCFQGVCVAGICSCETGFEVCGGACRVKCSGFAQRNPDTCECCGKTESSCGIGSQCCSGTCQSNFCRGRNGLTACSFDGQCQSGECREGLCTCLGTICNGVCGPTCAPDRASQNPATCDCCLNNGIQSNCPGGSCACCCSGQCSGIPPICTGLPAGASCEFSAQCVSGTCQLTPAGDF